MKTFLMSVPMTLVRTAYPEDYLSMTFLITMGVRPCNILWDYEGQYFIIPVQHVATKMKAYREEIKKAAPHNHGGFNISMVDAMPLDYEIGKQLARRAI